MTTTFEISFRGRIRVRSTIPDVNLQVGAMADDLIDAHLHEVMDHLMETEDADERLSNADLSASLATGETEISITVEAPADDAARIGMAAIRSAIHAAGGYTPNWDDEEPSARWALEDGKSQQKALDPV